jgi:hypothetical protein
VIAASSGDSYARHVYAAGYGVRALPHTEKDIGLVEAELAAYGSADNDLRRIWRASADYAAQRRAAGEL